MKVKEDQVFLVSGFYGDTPSRDNLFIGYCVALDERDAATYMKKLMGLSAVTGVNSLQQMKNLTSLLERIRDGHDTAPVSEKFAQGRRSV